MGNTFSETSKRLLSQLLERYSGYFDVTQAEALAGRTPDATAHFISKGEKYVLIKRAKIWAIECHEYVYFFRIPKVDAPQVLELLDWIRQIEPLVVHPHKEHYYTYLSIVLLTHEVTPQGKKEIRKSRFTKNYQFSLQGYSTYRLAVLDIQTMKTYYNGQGTSMKKLMNGFVKTAK